MEFYTNNQLCNQPYEEYEVEDYSNQKLCEAYKKVVEHKDNSLSIEQIKQADKIRSERKNIAIYFHTKRTLQGLEQSGIQRETRNILEDIIKSGVDSAKSNYKFSNFDTSYSTKEDKKPVVGAKNML